MKFWPFGLLVLFTTHLAFGNIEVFFNHRSTSSYSDPYRNIARSGDNLEEVLLKHIRKAKKSIYVAVQELRLPLVAKALIEKNKEGVDVRLVIEHDYHFNILSQRDNQVEGEYEATKLAELRAFIDVNGDGRIQLEELETRDAIYMLSQSKVKILDDTSDSSLGAGLMHHKFMIIDGQTVIVSTANFTMSCIHGDMLAKRSLGNANSLVVIRSPDLASIFNQEFKELWGNGVQGVFGAKKTYRPPSVVHLNGKKITVQFSPTSERLNWSSSVNGLMARELQKAQSSIKAALFVFSEQKLADVLKARHTEGVSVNVIGEPKFSYRDYSELLDLAGVQMLSSKCSYEAQNNPWSKPADQVLVSRLPQGDVLHHKFAVIDQEKVIVGSQNWSLAANHVNDETLIIIEDRETADQFAREYDRASVNSINLRNNFLWELLTRIQHQCESI